MEVPRHWRLKAQRYRLEGSICPTCGQVSFPPRPVCPGCTAQTVRITDYGLSELPTTKRTFDIVSSKATRTSWNTQKDEIASLACLHADDELY